MSIISEALKPIKTGRLFAEEFPIGLGMVSAEKTVRAVEPHVSYEYKIAANISCTAIISDKDNFEKIIKNIKYTIVSNVYGEFLPHLNSIRMALYTRDFDAALEAVDLLEKEMFDVV